MTDQIAFSLPKDRVKEESQLIVTAYFRDRATQAADTPTNVYYRLDCLSTGIAILDWTSISTAASVSITITPTQNEIQRTHNYQERKQLTVAADYGLSTQYVESVEYDVVNLQGIT